MISAAVYKMLTNVGKESLMVEDSLIHVAPETIPPQKHNKRSIVNLIKKNVLYLCASRDDRAKTGRHLEAVVQSCIETDIKCFTKFQRTIWIENYVPRSGLKAPKNTFSDQVNREELITFKGNALETELDGGLFKGDIILPDLSFADHADEVFSNLLEYLECMSYVYQGDISSHGFFYSLQLREDLRQLTVRYLRARSQVKEKCVCLVSEVCRMKPVEDAHTMTSHRRILLHKIKCYGQHFFHMLNTFLCDLSQLSDLTKVKRMSLAKLVKATGPFVEEMKHYRSIETIVSRKQEDDVQEKYKDPAEVADSHKGKRSKSISSQISDSDSDSLSDNWSYIEDDIQINLKECHIPEKGNDRISNVDSVTDPDRNHFTLDIKRAVERFMLDTPTAHGARTASGDPDLLLKELTPTLPSFPDPSLDEQDAHQQPVVPCPEFQDPRVGKEPHLLHWTVASFRPRDSVRPRPRYSPQVHTEPITLDNLRQRMQQRSFRIASMVHIGSSLPLGVVRLADADLYYDEDKDEMCCCNCLWRMPRTQFQEAKDPVEGHSCRGRTRGVCGEGSMGIAGPAASVAHEDSLPLAECRDNALPPCVEVDGCVERNASDSLLLTDDTVTDCFSSSESIAQFPRERCTAECSGSFHQFGSETSSATMDALLSTGETASLVQQSSSNSVSCTNDQSSAEGTGFETDHTSSGEDMGSGQSPCLHTAEFSTESLTDAADQSFSEEEATRHDSETESTYHESHSPTESCGDEMHEDETDLKS